MTVDLVKEGILPQELFDDLKELLAVSKRAGELVEKIKSGYGIDLEA